MQYAISRYGLAEILAPIYTKYELAYPLETMRTLDGVVGTIRSLAEHLFQPQL